MEKMKTLYTSPPKIYSSSDEANDEKFIPTFDKKIVSNFDKIVDYSASSSSSSQTSAASPDCRRNTQLSDVSAKIAPSPLHVSDASYESRSSETTWASDRCICEDGYYILVGCKCASAKYNVYEDAKWRRNPYWSTDDEELDRSTNAFYERYLQWKTVIEPNEMKSFKSWMLKYEKLNKKKKLDAYNRYKENVIPRKQLDYHTWLRGLGLDRKYKKNVISSDSDVAVVDATDADDESDGIVPPTPPKQKSPVSKKRKRLAKKSPKNESRLKRQKRNPFFQLEAECSSDSSSQQNDSSDADSDPLS